MSADPELLSWAKTIVASLLSSGVVGIIGAKAWKFFIVRPLEKAEHEAQQYKDLWKEEQRAREKRIEEAETALFGRPSMRYREEQPTFSMLIESTRKRDHEDELQRRMLADRARELPPADPLEAFARGPSVKDLLPAGAGRTDYDERRQRNAQQGFDTPTAYRPRQTTNRDEDTPREPVAGRRGSKPGT